MDAKRNIPGWAAKGSGEIFRKYIFSGSFRTGQQEILSAEQRRDGFLPYFPSVIQIAGNMYPGLCLGSGGIFGAEELQFLNQVGADTLFEQKFQQNNNPPIVCEKALYAVTHSALI